MPEHDSILDTPVAGVGLVLPDGGTTAYDSILDTPVAGSWLVPPYAGTTAETRGPINKIVKVFVRLGDSDGERTIAFRIPKDLDPMDLLERGATIDGNQAVLSVAWDDEAGAHQSGQSGGAYSCADLNDRIDSAGRNYGTGYCFEGKSMTKVLGDCQRGLVKFFKDRGYTVQFA